MVDPSAKIAMPRDSCERIAIKSIHANIRALRKRQQNGQIDQKYDSV